MKKLIITVLVMGLLAVSCGETGTSNLDTLTDEMTTYENDRVSFLVPEGWVSQDFLFRDPPMDLVRAGVEVVFYPEDQKFDDLLEPLSVKDFRYTNFKLGNRTLIIFFKGTSSRYYFNGTDNERTTFYEGTITDYQKRTLMSGETPYDACSALIESDGLVSGASALMYVMYGDRQPMINTAISTFYGIAVVSENIGEKEHELFEKIVSSFEYKTR